MMLAQWQYPNLWNGCVGAWCPSRQSIHDQLWDYSGYQHHGDLENIDTSDWLQEDAGIFGRGLALGFNDGGGSDNEAVDMPYTDALHLRESLTLSFWLKPRTWNSVYGIIQHSAQGETEDTNVAYGLYMGSTAGDVAYIHEDGLGNNSTYAINSNLVMDEWCHVLCIRDDVAKTVETRFNGVRPTANLSYSNSHTGGTSGNLRFAHNVGSGGNPYADIVLDDIRIFNRALAEPEWRVLTRRRGIAYEQRRRAIGIAPTASSFQPAWAASATTITGVAAG